jgi:plastocyanin
VVRLALVVLVSLLVRVGTPAHVDVQGLSSAGGFPVGEAVVWLDAPGPRRPSAPTVIDQRNLAFAPRVAAVQAGTTVRFPNRDRVIHNVFSTHESTKFDLGFYPVGAVKDWKFDRAGLSRIFCSIHPQMTAYVMVLDTPYFAQSDTRGQFVIRDVPPGTYRVSAWRPGGAILHQTLSVGPDTRFHVQWP